MERDINLDEISDGKLYDANDMVKVGCGDCAGCSACCHGMGDTIVLDPYDIWQLTSHLGCTFEELLSSGRIALHVYEGLILPSLNLAGEDEGCTFLNKEGRCTIHSFRPGICRCFPLGRLYENGSFRYFLQVHECRKESRTKMKIRKWLEIPDLRRYEQFISDWHFYIKALQEEARTCKEDDRLKALSMQVLQNYYLIPYDAETDFYEQFYNRRSMGKANDKLNEIK